MKVSKKFLILFVGAVFGLIAVSFGIFKLVEYQAYVKDSPYDVLLSDIQSNSVTISWKSASELPTYVKIGENEKLFGQDQISKIHKVKLEGLKESSTYTFVISDGNRDWVLPSESNSEDIQEFLIKEFVFTTKESKEEITIPEVREIQTLPNEEVYLVAYDPVEEKYSDIKTYTANRFGGIAVDIYSFEGVDIDEGTEIKNIGYTDRRNILSQSYISSIFASEINCNESVSAQSVPGSTKEGYTDLATRWVAGRGKNYASECYNDVVYRSKRAGFDPAFTLSIWLNESGASNYTQNMSLYGLIEDFGIHGLGSVPPQNFDKQITHFLGLKFEYSCPGLNYWEAWGNMYKWGNCNTDDPVKRQDGIDYYKQIETVYSWVTNGRSLPSKINGYPPSGEDDGGGDDDGGGGWEDTDGSICCALKIDNREDLRGDYENNVEGKTCDDLWKVGRSVYGGKLEYSVEIPDKVAGACEVDYSGVCCQLENDIKWYPKSVCKNQIPSVANSQACKEYANNRACFLRDGSYQWLPKSIADDYLVDVTTESQCKARNNLSTYKITIEKGINFVGFDFSPVYQAKEMYASEVIKTNSNILLIGNFEGYEWKDLVKKSEELPFAGNDFYLKQNKGYLIVSSEEFVLELDGWKDSSAKYLEIQPGWNLVGGSLYTKSSKASSLISAMEKNSIDIDTVGVWSKELARFNYRREEEDGQIFGDDVKLESNSGIFLRK